MTTTEGQRAGFRPQPRPDWVTEINTVGANHGSPETLVSLDEQSLIAAAIESSGGLEDFGDDAWRTGFGLLVGDMNNVAELTLIGRLLARSEVIRSLRTRLEIAETYRQYPQIDQERIEEPVFIAGPARSGTSILVELMAQDPSFRAPLTGELLYPCPPPDIAARATDPRFAKAGADQEMCDLSTPEFKAMHENRPDAPNECHVGLLHEFASGIWGARHDVPNYAGWIGANDGSQGYRFHRRLLKLLQSRAPGRWLLKGPLHLSTLPALFAEYPDARVIITHRDPFKAVPSLVSLMATLRWQRSDKVDYERLVKNASMSSRQWDNVMQQRRSGLIPEDRIIDVLYSDLIKDPINMLQRTYEQLGTALSADAEGRMRAYLEAKPKDRHGAHGYSFEDLGLDRAATKVSFAAYMQRYQVPEEP